ncbi:hypothetical protein PR048_010463 [Dryococelus australis]|uniref:DDE-1 domain-containing protein n=1 Tax=Dryococelus australis TaxID=614101 RepID=A0ABQ9I2S3_9NEOP|nr:hypothetical protein PR048_010463 [Dryococelus australis]
MQWTRFLISAVHVTHGGNVTPAIQLDLSALSLQKSMGIELLPENMNSRTHDYLRRGFKGPKRGKFSQLKAEVLSTSYVTMANSFKANLCQTKNSRLIMKKKVTKLQLFALRARQQTAYLLSQRGNADQTPVYFDMPRNSTIIEKGMQSVPLKTTGCENLQCTIILAITADGRKLPPYVIFKRKKHAKGCTLLKQPAMLLLDSFRGHLHEYLQCCLREKQVLQQLDFCTKKTFKDLTRSFYERFASNKDDETPTGKLKQHLHPAHLYVGTA